jgi:uncharacterized protein YfaS (alpha-2-macroglobulin family)
VFIFINVIMVLGCLLTSDVSASSTGPSPIQPLFSAELEKQADEYLKEIEGDKKMAASKAETLKTQMQAGKAFYANDTYGVIYTLQVVLKNNSKDLQAWIMLVSACSRKELASDNYMKKKAIPAAINAYRVATDPLEKAAVLQILYTIDGSFQEAYKAELTKFGQKKIDEKLRELTADYPRTFGLYDVEIPEKSEVGSACFSFTKPLLKLKSFAYEDYIAIQPQVKDMSVVAKSNRLCLSGLGFGSSYKVTLKKGLAGEGTYKLAEDQTVDLLIKHRKPSIVFRERGYILPAKGPQLLPLKAINVPKVNVSVFRVPLQNLPAVLNQNDFQSQLYPWKVEQLKNEQGEMIASGAFDSNGNIDETVVRGLPLDKILGDKLEPGVYVIQAQAGDKASHYDDENATQWVVVSDIGLSTYWGPDGLHVMARSLASAKELGDVEVSIIARNGRNLGTIKTDKNGYGRFDDKILSGKDSNQPVFISATFQSKDFTFISFKKEGFDFSDRGVKGRAPAQKADAYVYTERGIYRPGDKVAITALLRDQGGKAMPSVPLTFRIFRPDGVEAFTEVTQEVGAGAHAFVLDTQTSSFTGHWSVAAYLDPKGPEVGRTTFRLEDFIPPRVDVKATIKNKVVHAQESLETDITARYFYGPVASNLKVEGMVELVEATMPFEKWKDYHFGLEEESWTSLKFKADGTTTDEKGQAIITSAINIKPDTTKVLMAKSIATVFEAGGRGRSVTADTLFWHQPYAIGISPQFKDKTSSGNTDASFNLIAVDETGALKDATGLKYALYEETHGFTWFRSGSAWNYEVMIDDKQVATGKVELKGDGPSSLKVPAQFGYYRLEIMDDKTGVASSYRFHAGWGGISEVPDRPDMIEMSLDKTTYKVGEKAILSMKPPFDGELEIVAIDEKTLHQVYRGKASQKGTHIEVPLNDILQKSGTYLMATVYRPEDIKSEKAAGRAIGLIWVDAKGSMPKVEVTVKTPNVIQPEKEFEAKVCLSKSIKNPFVTIAVVDEAILQLTEFKTPDPFDYIYDQTKLAFTVRDSYGQLINPFGARPGDFKVGGDGLQQKALAKLAARTFKTVSLFSGILSDFKESKEEGCAQVVKVSFKLPDFSGQVRVMAVAWNDDATGSAESSITVRDDLETYMALPRFLAPGDQTTLIIDAQNLTGVEGTFKLTLKAEGEVVLAKEFSKTLTLAKDQMVHMPVEIKAKDVGVGKLTLHIEGKDLVLDKHWEIAVRSPVFHMTRRSSGFLKPGDAVNFNESSNAGFKVGTESLVLNIGSLPTYGADGLRKEMRAYPYACLEQLTSRLVAELYVSDDKRDATRVLDIISQLLSLQHFDGPFSLWSANGSAESWLSMYAMDLLNKGQMDKLEVAPAAINRGMDWIKERLRQDSNDAESLSIKAYGHYILAQQGQGSLGALKYFADNSQEQLKDRDDLTFIGGAFALYGDAASAKVWFDKALAAREESESDYSFFQSWLSHSAILVTVMADTVQNHPQLMNMALQLSDMAAKTMHLSTFEKGWLIRASSALATLAKPFKLNISGEAKEGTKPLSMTLQADNLKKGIPMKNEGQNPLSYTLSVEGEPMDPSKLPNNGFLISRELYNLNGQAMDLNKVKSGDLLVVVLKGELTEDDTHEILVLDLLPAGFEIEKVKFDESYMKNNFVWLNHLTELSRVEKRDDRYMAAFRLGEKKKFVMTYFVRALNPGVYKYPGASVESMYRPEFTARTPEGILTIKP